MTTKTKYFDEDTVEYCRLANAIQSAGMKLKKDSPRGDRDHLSQLQAKLIALELKMGIKNGSTS